MQLDLSGKKAFVCGSSKGIGRAVAISLAQSGAGVTLIARNESALKQVKAELCTKSGQRHDVLVADFDDPERLGQVVSDYLSDSGPVEIVINNTGGPAPGPAHLASVDAFVSAFRAHLICSQLLVSQCLPGMQKAGWGRVINMISTSVKQPIMGLGVSNTIRGAVASWAKTLAGELAPFGITVNNVLPGATETERLAQIIENKSNKLKISTEDVVKKELAAIPAGRFAKPEDIAAAVTFLASPQASYINGINLPVDGGRTSSL